MVRLINELDFCLIHAMQFIMVEYNLLWDTFELGPVKRFNPSLCELLVCVSQCLIIRDGRSKMALIFGEGYFTVHSFDDFIVVDLLLDV